jgi:hypothetical protein
MEFKNPEIAILEKLQEILVELKKINNKESITNDRITYRTQDEK